MLLRPRVMVYEPLWTLIPSNKAILPVLWELYPHHPYLLEAAFELTDTLRASDIVALRVLDDVAFLGGDWAGRDAPDGYQI